MKPARVALLCLALAACGGESTTPGEGADVEELPADQIAYGLEHIMTKQGVREATLRADTAYFRESDADAELVGVQLDFFDENGARSGHLTSRTGSYDRRQGSMTARGNVVLVINRDGGERQIETEELHYNLGGDRIWSDKPTVSREGGTVYRGSSFTSDAKFQNVQVKNATTSGGIPTGESQTSF